MSQAGDRAPQTPSDGPEFDKELPFLAHLRELRDRLLRMVLAIAVIFICLMPFAGELYLWLIGPLTAVMPEGTTPQVIDPAGGFFVPFKMALLASVFIAVPYLLYQLWAFVAPGLYLHERRMVFPLMTSSTVLFYLGAAFAYFVVFPLMFKFFVAITPEGIAMNTDIGRYLSFVTAIFFAFGVAFEVPIATILLVWIGVTTPDQLAKKRPYVIVGAFVLGMLLTPPDAISQTLLAIPMWILFELGIIFSRIMIRKKQQREAQEAAESSTEGEDEDSAPTNTPTSDAAGPSAASLLGAAVIGQQSAGDSTAELETGQADEQDFAHDENATDEK